MGWDGRFKGNDPVIGYTNRVPNLVGGFRIRENQGYTYGSGATGLKTSHFKFEADAPFSAVRIWYGEKNIAGTTPPTLAALVAPTETGALDTVSNCFLPVAGGVAYNNLAASGPGWIPVTWNGASTVVPALAPSATNSVAYTCSDWIPCASLPRADVVGGRPMVVVRVANQNAAGYYTQANNGDTTSTYALLRGQDQYREFICGNTANDGIATLTNIPTAVSTKASYELYVWVEFLYDVPTRHVLVLGDSTMASAYSAYGMSYVNLALKPLSTQSAPISVTNLAGSGHSVTQFLALYDNLAAQGMRITDVVWEGWSQNGFGQNSYGAQSVIGTDAKYLMKLRDMGVQVWMTTAYGAGWNGTPEAARQQVIAKIKSWAAAGLVTLVDTDPIITDYSTGTRSLKSIYDSGDHIHANPAGQLAMANLLQSIWK